MAKKILLVEDDQTIGLLTERFLKTKGFSVLRCIDGLQASVKFEVFQPDLCVLDVMLPKMNGFSLATKIRSIDQSVPIIFLTVKSMLQDVLEGYNSGGSDYLKKPFSFEELEARVNALLHLAQAEYEPKNEPEILELGGYTFYLQENLLVYGEEEKNLTLKEAELLQILWKNLNTNLKKSDILIQLWGDDTYYNGRSMDVYISKLRKYLKRAPGLKIINLRGVGYKMVFSESNSHKDQHS